MSEKRPTRKDLCLYAILEANKRNAKLDMINLNNAMSFYQRACGIQMSPSKYGVYSADLVNDLTQLMSDGLVEIEKSRNQACFFVASAGGKTALSKSKPENWMVTFSSHDISLGREGPRALTAPVAIDLLSDASPTIRNIASDLVVNCEFFGDLRRNEGKFDEAVRLYSIALMLDAPPDRKVSVCFDLSDMFHQLRMTHLSSKYAEKAMDFLDVSGRDKSLRYSRSMQYLLGFRNRFYKAVAGAWCHNKIDQKQFRQALDYYSKFYTEARIKDLKQLEAQASSELDVFSCLLHEIGHCSYSPRWLSYDVVDDLLTSTWSPEPDKKYQIPAYLEFLSLVLVEAALCAYFSGDISEALKSLMFSQKLISHRRDDPIRRITTVLSSCMNNRVVKLHGSIFRCFDSDLRRAISLMPIRVLEEKIKASFSKEFNLSLQESEELLGFLDSVVTENPLNRE